MLALFAASFIATAAASWALHLRRRPIQKSVGLKMHRTWCCPTLKVRKVQNMGRFYLVRIFLWRKVILRKNGSVIGWNQGDIVWYPLKGWTREDLKAFGFFK